MIFPWHPHIISQCHCHPLGLPLMSRSGGRIEGLHLGDGATVHAGTVVNAAGTVPWDAVSKGSLQTGTVFFSVPKLFWQNFDIDISPSLSLWFREWHIVTHHNQLCKTLGSPCVGSWSMHKLRSGAFGGKMLGIPDEIGRSWSFIPRSIIIFPLRTT